MNAEMLYILLEFEKRAIILGGIIRIGAIL